MPKKKTEQEEAPKKLAIYTLKLDDKQMETLHAILKAKCWESFEVPYARYAYKGLDCNVTAYESRKVVIAGKGTEDFVINVLEPEVTKAPKLGYDEVLHPDWFEAHAGLDESGKGDFFGPVIAATVIADKAAIDAWIKAGVKDSKKIADTKIVQLEKKEVVRLWCIKDNKILLHKITASAKRLSGIHELPSLEESKLSKDSLVKSHFIKSKVRTITRFQITEAIYRHTWTTKTLPADFVWVQLDKISTITLSGPHKRWIVELLKQ